MESTAIDVVTELLIKNQLKVHILQEVLDTLKQQPSKDKHCNFSTHELRHLIGCVNSTKVFMEKECNTDTELYKDKVLLIKKLDSLLDNK